MGSGYDVCMRPTSEGGIPRIEKGQRTKRGARSKAIFECQTIVSPLSFLEDPLVSPTTSSALSHVLPSKSPLGPRVSSDNGPPSCLAARFSFLAPPFFPLSLSLPLPCTPSSCFVVGRVLVAYAVSSCRVCGERPYE
jgi:hypothetical protein